MIRRLLFRLTPIRLRCRLFGHVAKVSEWPCRGYEWIDESECGRCGKTFEPIAPIYEGHFVGTEAEFNEAFAKAFDSGTVQKSIGEWLEKDPVKPDPQEIAGRDSTAHFAHWNRKRAAGAKWPDWGCVRKHTFYCASRDHESGPGAWHVVEFAGPMPDEFAHDLIREVCKCESRYDAEAMATFLNDFAPDEPISRPLPTSREDSR